MNVQQALIIANLAHKGQKYGDRAYIYHPISVWNRVRTQYAPAPDGMQVVAILHDTVEDCQEMTLRGAQTLGLGERALKSLDRITRRESESYGDYIHRVAGDEWARQIKICDLQENLANEPDENHARRYKRALSFLLAEDERKRCNVGDLTMNELAARGCETEKARQAFVEWEGL